MSEYKCVKVVNKTLTEEDFMKAHKLLCRLEIGILSDRKDTILFSGKSDKKEVFSVDSGCFTNELNAFKNAIKFYLGNYVKGVEIVVCEK